MDNLPVLKKCCFCLPLRYGLLTWGYIKLISGLLVLIVLTIVLSALWSFLEDVGLWVTIWVCILFAQLISDIIIHLIFIIGAHKKNVKLLRVYYYYAIFIWILTIAAAIISTALLIDITLGTDVSTRTELLLSDILSYLLSITIQSFLLLAVRSEIIKLRSNCPYRFVKNPDDLDGTIREEDMSSDGKDPKLLKEKESSRI